MKITPEAKLWKYLKKTNVKVTRHLQVLFCCKSSSYFFLKVVCFPVFGLKDERVVGGQACACRFRIWCHERGGFTHVPPLNHPPIAPLRRVSSYILWRGLYYRNVWSCPLLLRTSSAPITTRSHPDGTSAKNPPISTVLAGYHGASGARKHAEGFLIKRWTANERALGICGLVRMK